MGSPQGFQRFHQGVDGSSKGLGVDDSSFQDSVVVDSPQGFQRFHHGVEGSSVDSGVDPSCQDLVVVGFHQFHQAWKEASGDMVVVRSPCGSSCQGAAVVVEASHHQGCAVVVDASHQGPPVVVDASSHQASVVVGFRSAAPDGSAHTSTPV